MKNAVFWNVAPCGSCGNRRLQGTKFASEEWLQQLARGVRIKISECLPGDSKETRTFLPLCDEA
jgi:hypothetical protein